MTSGHRPHEFLTKDSGWTLLKYRSLNPDLVKDLSMRAVGPFRYLNHYGHLRNAAAVIGFELKGKTRGMSVISLKPGHLFHVVYKKDKPHTVIEPRILHHDIFPK